MEAAFQPEGQKGEYRILTFTVKAVLLHKIRYRVGWGI